mgnify:CR=1 FL=1
MNIEAKICGLSTAETVRTALDAGASYVGFVFYPPSPRNISIEKAAELAEIVKEDALKVGVFVNPDDALLHDVFKQVDLDVIQLHGNEDPERVKYISTRFAKSVMKAISVSDVSDLNKAKEYESVCDMLLFDAKAPIEMHNALPGGNGLVFDWKLIADYQWNVPWMLSGGLHAKNVQEAIKISGAKIVDISSGLESEPGNKDISMIETFMKVIQETKE